MSEDKKKRSSGSLLFPIILFVLAGILGVASVGGFILQGTEGTKTGMKELRTSAVLHAASEGLINNIAQQARSEKLKELRADKNFRKKGLDEVNSICDAAMEEARAEAEKLYSNPRIEDKAALESAIDEFEAALKVSDAQSDKETAVFQEIYTQLLEGISDWKTVAAEDMDDAAVAEAMGKTVPSLLSSENSFLQPGFVRLARDQSSKQTARETEEQKNQLISLMNGEIADWTELSGLEDDALWERLSSESGTIAANPGFRDALVEAAKNNIAAVEEGREIEEPSQTDEGAVIAAEAQIDNSYFTPSETLNGLIETKNAAFEKLFSQLALVIPDLNELNSKLQDTLRSDIEKVVYSGDGSFASQYNTYISKNTEAGSASWQMKLASVAKPLLLGAIAVLLLSLVLFFWGSLTGRFGVPRTIIALFFVYLCLLAELYGISLNLMLGNVLERMTMYGILVLAMMPGIQCGIGLNMGMTIGCISGLLGIVLSLQFNMTGFGALIFACLSGAVIALPLGWAYSMLLNRMKGNEMTISTYVGFSFVSLMCIGWMLLPFNNPKIIWLLSGRGLRVTHSLLGSFAHLLDNALSFRIFGVKIPTGGLLFLAFCCLLMWLFSRSKTGIAMTAAGSNPRFAEASGINVNHMRTVGTVLSTMIAAVGIVIYSQAFGYAQLYTAPRQLGFIASSAILIGGATVSKARVSHVLIGVFLFEGVLVFGQQIANSVVAGGGLSEVMRIMISNGIILYALTQSGGGSRD